MSAPISSDWIRDLEHARAQLKIADANRDLPRHLRVPLEAVPRRDFKVSRRTLGAGLIASAVALCMAGFARATPADQGTRPGDARADLNGTMTDDMLRGYGAYGDGSSHPVSTVIGAKIPGFSSLSAAAQLTAIQGFAYVSCSYATSLSDEMDLLAIRAAVAAVLAAGGGTVRARQGTYLCSAPLPTVPAASTQGSAAAAQQATWNLVGDGSTVTVFRFPNDITSGAGTNFALQVANRSNAAGDNFDGTWAGFTFVGPSTTFTAGTSTNVQLSGLGWGARRGMEDVHILGFYQGMCVEGDQTLFRRVMITNCVFGAYWDLANGTLFGDMHFDRCSFLSCNVAAIGCSPVSQIAKTVWTKPIFATSPVLIAKITNTSASGWQPNLLFEAEMHGAQFEQMGYAAITELASSNLQPTPNANPFNANVLVDCQLYRTEFGPYYSAAKFPSVAFQCPMWEGQNMLGKNYCELSIEGNIAPGAAGLFNVQSYGYSDDGENQTIIRGDWPTILGNMGGKALNPYSYADPEALFIIAPNYVARLLYDNTGTNPTAGTVVAINYGNGAGFGMPAATTADAQFGLAVTLYKPTTATQYQLCAIEGFVPVLVGTTWTGSQTVKANSSGLAIAATGPYDQTSAVLGVSLGAPSGSPLKVSVEMRPIFPWAPL